MSGPADAQLALYGSTDSAPPALPALAMLRDQAAARGYELLVLLRATDAESERALAKRRHDVRAALRTLGNVHRALREGYRFDDAVAEAKIEALGKALAVVERESDLLCRLLHEG